MIQIGDLPVQESVEKVIDAIRTVRESLGVSKYRMAKLTGLHPSTIGLVEQGKRSPSLFVVLKMAASLELDLGQVLHTVGTAVPPEDGDDVPQFPHSPSPQLVKS